MGEISMNNEHGNKGNIDLNGKPYHSADRGYAYAAAGRGVAEAVREHINVIVRNEELEMASDHELIREEIEALQDKKNELEKSQDACQKEIRARELEITEQEGMLSELKAKLNAPAEADVMPAPDPRIDELCEDKKQLEQELAAKTVTRAGIKAEAKAPMAVELLKTTAELMGVNTPKIGFSVKQLCVALAYTFSLIGLIGYIYFFYASVAEKSFVPKTDEQSDERNSQIDKPALNQYVDPFAVHKAWNEDPRNWFVLLFPMIFIIFAIVLHFCLSSVLEAIPRKWLNIGAIIFLILTLFFDVIIANNISENIYDIKKDRENTARLIQMRAGLIEQDNTTVASEEQNPTPFSLLPIIFLGFVPSLLLTCGLYATFESWSNVRPWGQQIKAKKHEYKVQLANLASEIEALENNIDSLDTQIAAQIKAHRHPIQINIDRIETEKEHTEKEVNLLNKTADNIGEEINKCQTKISELDVSLKRPEIKSIDVKRMEKHVKEFVNGWCRFVAWQETELTDTVSDKIMEIQRIADQTLNEYKSTLT